VPENELNLLQFAAGGGAESSATLFSDADPGGELLDDVPDELFRYSFRKT
jgi:hypothetical protein